MNKQVKKQSGFTVVELMIATTVFSIILVVCTAAIIQISRLYYKSITASRTQEAARSIIEEISQGIQFTAGPIIESTVYVDPAVYTLLPDKTGYAPTPTSPPAPPGLTGQGSFCLDRATYKFVLGRRVVETVTDASLQIKDAFVFNPTTVCEEITIPIGPPSADGRQLVPENMRLTNLGIKKVNNNLYSVTVRLVYGEDDLLCSEINDPGSCTRSDTMSVNHFIGSDVRCKDKVTGSQFCAVSELSTTVQKRVQ